MSNPTATITRVARPRGTLTRSQRELLADSAAILADKQRVSEAARDAYRFAVVQVLNDGASFAEVSRETGLSTNTLQRWKREAGK